MEMVHKIMETERSHPVEEPDPADEPAGAGVAFETSPEWIGLLTYLQNARGFDFHGYKPASLARRIGKRMDMVGIDGFAG